jgi:exosortase
MVLTSSTQDSASKLSPLFRFSVLGAISLLIWWNPLISSFALALRDDRYTHILLILPVSISLIYLDWKSADSPPESRSGLGLILLVAAIGATIVARVQMIPLHSDERLSANMLALVVWWIGAFVVSFGTRAFQRALFPLCFLFWIVPIPEFVLSPIVRLLQQGSVASARLLFALIGVPSARDGTLITIPGLTVEVAPECSSIRSSLMLGVTTMVLAQMLLRSAWRKALVIAVAIPLSVAKNGLRIFVLAMLTTRVNRSFITGRLHHQGGIIYFLIALATVILLIWIARRGDA